MIIGFDAKRLLHNHTGLGNYARNLLSALISTAPQNEYHLFSPRSDANPPYWPHRNHPSLVYHHPRSTRLARGIRNSIWRTLGVAGIAAQSGVQLYHGLSHELPQGLSRRGISSIVTLHDLIFLRHPEWFPLTDRFFYRQKVLRACRQADQIVAISECTAQDIVELLKIPRNRIRVMYQSVSPDFSPIDQGEWRNAPQDSTKPANTDTPVDASGRNGAFPDSDSNSLPQHYILAVGSCDARKNYHTVIEAYSQLPQDRPALVLTGPGGSDRKKILTQIRASNLSDCILWRQPGSSQELAQLYRGARFSVYLSRYEGFGLPVLESIACGTPVLAAHGSSLEEAGGNAAVYVRATDPEAATLAMRRLLYDEAFYQSQAQHCLPWAARFSPHELAQNWIEMYGQLIPHS